MTEQNTNQDPKPGSAEYITALNAALDASAAQYQKEEFKVKAHEDNLKQFDDAVTKSSSTSGLKLLNKRVDNQQSEIKELDAKVDRQQDHIAGLDEGLEKASGLALTACKNTHILKDQVDKTVTEVDSMKSMLINGAKDSNDQKYSDTYKMALPSAKHQEIAKETGQTGALHFMFATDMIEDKEENDIIVTESYQCPQAYEPYYVYEANKEKDTDSEFYGELVYTGCVLRSQQCNQVENSDKLEFIRGAEDQVCYASLISTE